MGGLKGWRRDALPTRKPHPHRHSNRQPCCDRADPMGAGVSEDTALSEAKQVLLRALDSITEIEQEMDAEVRHVAVVYSVYREEEGGGIHEQGGWNHSSDPAWLIGAMLRRGADAVEGSPEPADDGEG